MSIANYRKNVFKTLSVKPAKLGLRTVASNTKRTNVMHCAIGFHTEVSEFVSAMAPVITGSSRLTDDIRLKLFTELGDVMYYMAVLTRELHVKVPTTTKKTKLKDKTRAVAALELLGLATTIGGLAKKNFYGPKMKAGDEPKYTYTDVKDADGNVVEIIKTPKPYEVIDKQATEALFEGRHQLISSLLPQAIELIWALSFDLLGVPPQEVMDGNIAKLSQRYGEGFFTLESAEDRDTEAEDNAATSA